MLYCPSCGEKTERRLIDLKRGDIVCEKCSYRGGYYETNATWFDCMNEESKYYLNRVDKYFTCSKAEKDKSNYSINIGEILADNLKSMREYLKLSYKKLSDISGVPADCIEKIEKDESFPFSDELEKLAKAMDMETQELFSMPISLEKERIKMRYEIVESISTSIRCDIINRIDEREKIKKMDKMFFPIVKEIVDKAVARGIKFYLMSKKM